MISCLYKYQPTGSFHTRLNSGTDNFGRCLTSPRLDYTSSLGHQTELEDIFEDCDFPSFLLNASSLHSVNPVHYLPSIPSYEFESCERIDSNMSNPNFIAQYREPSLSPTRHPGYKLRQPEYRPGYLTSRSNTQYNIGAPTTIIRNTASDDMALCTGRLGTSDRRSRPLARHQSRYRSLSTNDEFVHNRGVFNTTTPNVRGHFIIHPDWVSEKMTPRN